MIPGIDPITGEAAPLLPPSTPLGKAVLLPYQRAWVRDEAQVKIAEKSRRVGLTFAEAADDALYAASEEGDDVWYVGYNQDMAREFVDTCAMWAKAYNRAVGELEEFLFEDADEHGNTKQIKAFRIDFPSGHKIVALSSRPTSLRGKQGRAVLDEFAFHGEQKELLKAALAFLIWGGAVRIISTHDGVDNGFNELIEDVKKKRLTYSLHHITFDDAIADGLYRRICERLKREWTAEGEREWSAEIYKLYGAGADEELRCIPRAGGGAYIPSTLIDRCMDDAIPVVRWAQSSAFAQQPKHIREADTKAWCEEHLRPLLAKLEPHMAHYLGEDFGRSGDLTVLWPLFVLPNLDRRTPFIVELRNIPFEQQKQVVFYVLDRLPRFTAAKFDARGNGQYLAEVAMQRYTADRIEQVMLTAAWYSEHMPQYKAAYEDGTIAIPRNADVLADHRAITIENGIPKIHDGKRTTGTDGMQRHGDSAVAGCLAYAASFVEVSEYDYQSAGSSFLGQRVDAREAGPRNEQDDRDDRNREFAGTLRFRSGAW